MIFFWMLFSKNLLLMINCSRKCYVDMLVFSQMSTWFGGFLNFTNKEKLKKV